ncbi:MAG: hypothetical protein FVQ81_09175 [Candidatus Glassbacteria bacterium]|nr:hypothetical protein [Candidatus Glassbacteria bacterium]
MKELTDDWIEELLREEKRLPPDYKKRLTLKIRNRNKEAQLELEGENGNYFRLLLRQSQHNHLSFSVILAYCPQETNRIIILRRYNGNTHEHTNHLEKETFRGFHKHTATEKYVDSPWKDETYAELSKSFFDLDSALSLMLQECGFTPSLDGQMKLW